MKIREAWISDAPALARIHVDGWRRALHGILPDERLAVLSYATREEQWNELLTKPSDERLVVFVAEDQTGQVIGFSSAGPEKDRRPRIPRRAALHLR